jgi:hypothetical protein
MTVSALEQIKKSIGRGRAELTARRKEIERKIAGLERELAFIERQLGVLDGFGGRRRGRPRKATARRPSRLAYGGVRQAVLETIRKAGTKGIRPRDIVATTGLGGPQVHNTLTGLKKDKLVKAKDRRYRAA